MALYWPEARIAVSCEGATGGPERGDLPPDVLVINMRPEQAESEEFVETVRDLVIERVIERRRLAMEELFMRGDSLPAPRGGDGAADDPTSGDVAERRLRELLLAGEDLGDSGERDGGADLPDGWELGGYGFEAYGPEGLLVDPLGMVEGHATGVRLVIGHCDEVFVQR